jgi:diguanylate cyclase (GGDEF)-like protein
LRFERLRSSTDELTGLANRRALYAILEAQIARVEGDRVAVILLDVDRFKTINDTFGHNAGDEVLIGFAELLRRSVAPSVNVGRWGGEEFLLVLPESNLGLALAQAEKIRGILERHDFEVGQVTASFGVACLHPDESLSDLIRRADLALYAAKSRGRNRVEHQVRVIDQVGKELAQDLEPSSDVAQVPNVS